MKINYLKLNNIGPYFGTHLFDLNTNSRKNVVLIGGKNGAGKTTFLKAIKYGLFGSFALGLKTDTDSYFKEIKTILNNKSAKNYSVEIEFEYIENFETKKYQLIRSWKNINGEISEEIRVISNNYLLDQFETKELQDKLRAITSPQLINSYIFDGEKIGAIIEDGRISEYLEETFNSIFSIDLISQTKKDLENYLSKKADESNAKSQIDNINYITKINTLKNSIKSIELQLNDVKANKNNLNTIRKSNMENFYKLGGLTKKQQEIYSKQLDSFNSEKEKMNKEIRSYIESELPLYMNYKLMEDAFGQANIESHAKYPKYLEEIEKLTGMNLKEVKSRLLDVIIDCQVIHNLTDEERDSLSDRLMYVMAKTDDIKPYLKNKYAKTDEYKLMKKSMIDNENIESINRIIDENAKIDVSLTELDSNINELNSKLNGLNEELQMYYALYEKSNDELKKDKLLDSSFVIGKRALDICDKFASQIKVYKLHQISKTALEIFNDTIRKKDFITDICIMDNFDLKLHNAFGTKIDPKTLSAGEMQILVSSLIWAMFRISGRREMFIFDTPLARLDVDNRQNFISKIISTISSQVVVLSTDSEFVGKNLDIIKDNICKKYLLEYNVKNATTSVKDSYFGG